MRFWLQKVTLRAESYLEPYQQSVSAHISVSKDTRHLHFLAVEMFEVVKGRIPTITNDSL